MPVCNCESYGCVNQNLDKRTFKKHQDADQLLWRRSAYEQHQKTIRKHDEALASEVAALTLSGKAFTSTSSPEASRLEATADIFNVTPLSPFQELDNIDQALSSMDKDIQPHLHHLGRPASRTENFPLQEEFLRARALEPRLARVLTTSAPLRARKQRTSQHLQELLKNFRDLSELWRARADEFELPSSSHIYVTEHHFQPILDGVNPIIQISLFTMVALQVVAHLSRRGCHFLLSMIRYIIQLAFYHERQTISQNKAAFVEQFPLDPDSATSKFGLDAKETVYAVCPNAKCHKTYAPTYIAKSAIPHYPKFCTHQEFKDSKPCGTAITRKKMYHETEIQIPIKEYVSFNFKDYVANLLARPGFEDIMDNPKTSTVREELIDVYDGGFMTIFAHASDEPFKSTIDVGRYTFSVCMDFFNPFSNKQAGKKVSIGIISVVCLSLPYTHRYKFENMFLAGVIPGPNEPPLTTTNHYMTPLINELTEFWQPGVHFSRTLNRPNGRVVQCALIIVICDLLAARKAAGLAACTHEHFCSICHCTRSKHGYGNTNFESWNRRTAKDIRSAAESYHAASSAIEAQKIFDQTGVRWSELLRLPYFDPTQCVTVDSMHNLLLGLLKEHFMNILGIGLSVEREQPVLALDIGTIPSTLSANDRKGVAKLKKLLQAPASTSFPDDRTQAISKLTSNVTMSAIKFVCAQVQCAIPSDTLKPNKTTVAGHLLDWRLLQPEVRQPNAETSTTKGHVLNLSDMEEIWKDIREIHTPSWSSSVPSNLGNASHGKLKADEWRTLGTLHLPLSLIRLWGTVDPSDRRSIRCHQILKVTMFLLSAVVIATSRTTSQGHAAAYIQHMRDYLDGVKGLFPDYEFRPNHHMALHIHEFLLLFGPVQSWWTFPFERLIGALQRTPHNSKIGKTSCFCFLSTTNTDLGELEATISRAHTRSANLLALLEKGGCPEVIRNSKVMFRKLANPQLRNLVQTDIRNLEGIVNEDAHDKSDKASCTKYHFSHDLTSAFKRAGITGTSEGFSSTNILIGGLTYSTHAKHKGNSYIALANYVPAYIEHIVRLLSIPDKWYLAIRRHKPTDRHHNPYKEYPIMGADLWSVGLDEMEIISPNDVLCHCACLPYDTQNVVVLPLSRTVSL